MEIKEEDTEDDGSWLLDYEDPLPNPEACLDFISVNWRRNVEDVIPKGISPASAPKFWDFNLLIALAHFSELTKQGTANAVQELARITRRRWENLSNKKDFRRGIANDPRLVRAIDVEETTSLILAREADARFRAENPDYKPHNPPPDMTRGAPGSQLPPLPSIAEMRRRTGMVSTKTTLAAPRNPSPKRRPGIISVKPLESSLQPRRTTSPPKHPSSPSSPTSSSSTSTHHSIPTPPPKKKKKSAQDKEDEEMAGVMAQYGAEYWAARGPSAHELTTLSNVPPTPKKRPAVDSHVENTRDPASSKRRKSTRSPAPEKVRDGGEISTQARHSMQAQITEGAHAEGGSSNGSLDLSDAMNTTLNPSPNPFKQHIPLDASTEYLRGVIDAMRTYQEQRQNRLWEFMDGFLEES